MLLRCMTLPFFFTLLICIQGSEYYDGGSSSILNSGSWDDEEQQKDGDDLMAEVNFVEHAREAKRSRWLTKSSSSSSSSSSDVLCGRFEDWCLPNSRNPVLRCCERYACRCSLWNTNCRCRTSLFRRAWKRK